MNIPAPTASGPVVTCQMLQSVRVFTASMPLTAKIIAKTNINAGNPILRERAIPGRFGCPAVPWISRFAAKLTKKHPTDTAAVINQR